MVRLPLAVAETSLIVPWQTKHGILGLFRSVYYNGVADGIKFVPSLPLSQPHLTPRFAAPTSSALGSPTLGSWRP